MYIQVIIYLLNETNLALHMKDHPSTCNVILVTGVCMVTDVPMDKAMMDATKLNKNDVYAKFLPFNCIRICYSSEEMYKRINWFVYRGLICCLCLCTSLFLFKC